MEHQTSNVKLQNKSQGLNPKIYDIRERCLVFSKRALSICKMLPRIPECENIRCQMASAVTSIGANYEEADGAITKKDFINKAAIARKEAKEARYWLRVISGTYIKEDELTPDIKEAEEIVNIISAIIRNSGIKRRP
ncbi:four helix bundle protein [Candidatus Margulisiibacteriota bacterium]